MARKPRSAKLSVKEKDLTKGQLRKLNALRKSIGDELGTKAFAEWLEQQETQQNVPVDPVAEAIAETIERLTAERRFRLPRQGYIVKRGRGRVIVKSAG